MKSLVFFSQAGCFLPLLIILNLLFGWWFLPPAPWLLVELILILLFAVNLWVFSKKITFSSFSPKRNRKNAIDTQAEVIEEKKEGGK